MTTEGWTAVDDYFGDQLSLSDDRLTAAMARSESNDLPAIQVSPAFGKLLHLLVRMRGCRRVLEIGTLGGYSTIWLARGLNDDGQVISLELEEHHAEVARANLAEAGLAECVDIRVGPAIESLKILHRDKVQPFDFVFIDADKANCPAYFDYAVKLSRPGTVIVVDNVVREGAVVDESTDDESVQGIREMMQRIQSMPQVSATAIQTVGCKGYDGFCIAIVE